LQAPLRCCQSRTLMPTRSPMRNRSSIARAARLTVRPHPTGRRSPTGRPKSSIASSRATATRTSRVDSASAPRRLCTTRQASTASSAYGAVAKQSPGRSAAQRPGRLKRRRTARTRSSRRPPEVVDASHPSEVEARSDHTNPYEVSSATERRVRRATSFSPR
jgi:hypothetical protein